MPVDYPTATIADTSVLVHLSIALPLVFKDLPYRVHHRRDTQPNQPLLTVYYYAQITTYIVHCIGQVPFYLHGNLPAVATHIEFHVMLLLEFIFPAGVIITGIQNRSSLEFTQRQQHEFNIAPRQHWNSSMFDLNSSSTGTRPNIERWSSDH